LEENKIDSNSYQHSRDHQHDQRFAIMASAMNIKVMVMIMKISMLNSKKKALMNMNISQFVLMVIEATKLSETPRLISMSSEKMFKNVKQVFQPLKNMILYFPLC